jgi:hypothetical protein
MSKIALTPNASGTGTLTIAAPNTNTDSTINLPDSAGSFVTANTSGDVGIGTSSPSTNLHVRGDGSGDFSPYNDVLRVQGDSYTVLHLKATNNQASMIYDRNGTTGWYSGLDNNGNYKMSYMSAMNGTGLGNAKDTATPAIYIDNQNSVYVGTAGNYPQNGSTGIKLEYTGRIVLSRSQETTLQQTRYGNDGTVTTFFRDANSVGSISVNNSSTAFNTNSDYRLKENVVEVTDGINRVKLLKPSRFNFISDPDKTVDGFLAHEVQDVVPEAIFGTKDAVDADGNPEYQGIDQSKLVPLLTAALQEAITKIESLEARVASLESA